MVGTVNGIFACDIEWDVAGNSKRWQYDHVAIVAKKNEKDAEKVNCKGFIRIYHVYRTNKQRDVYKNGGWAQFIAN